MERDAVTATAELPDTATLASFIEVFFLCPEFCYRGSIPDFRKRFFLKVPQLNRQLNAWNHLSLRSDPAQAPACVTMQRIAVVRFKKSRQRRDLHCL
jgi:hypothetical protein